MRQYDETIRRLIKENEQLKADMKRIALQRPLFTILNVNNPPQITSNQNDYDPGDYDMLRLTTDASRNITGISGGVLGRMLYLFNSGTQNIVLVHESALSVATNRINNPGAVNHTMTPGSTGTRSRLVMIYTGTRWSTLFESAP